MVNAPIEKPKLLDNQSIHYYSLTSIDFEKCYKVMDLRIKHGYSDRDLSFLLGYEALYVRKAENPIHKIRYKAKDTNYLRHIFTCELSAIMDGKLAEFTYDLCVLETANENKTKSFDIYIAHRGKYKLFRSFTELAFNERLRPRSIANPGEVVDYVQKLLNNGFFASPKTGLELFRECEANFGGHIKPTYIEEAIKKINKLDKEKAPPALKIHISKNGMSRWVYFMDGLKKD